MDDHSAAPEPFDAADAAFRLLCAGPQPLALHAAKVSGGPGRGLAPGGHAELGQDGGDVVVHGAGRYHQPLRDLRVRQPGRDQPQDLQLAIGQPGRVGQRARLRPARQPGDTQAPQPAAHERHRGRRRRGRRGSSAPRGWARPGPIRRAPGRARTGRPPLSHAVRRRPPVAAQRRGVRLRAAREGRGRVAEPAQVHQQLAALDEPCRDGPCAPAAIPGRARPARGRRSATPARCARGRSGPATRAHRPWPRGGPRARATPGRPRCPAAPAPGPAREPSRGRSCRGRPVRPAGPAARPRPAPTGRASAPAGTGARRTCSRGRGSPGRGRSSPPARCSRAPRGTRRAATGPR